MAVRVAGSINVDLIQSVEALPRAGETVLAYAFARLPGGKGANQAVAAARMGASTLMTGAVGDDEGGSWMLGLLRSEGIDTAGIVTMDGGSTGLAMIAVERAGENQIVVSPGANSALIPAQIRHEGGEVRIRLAQLEIPVEAVRAFLSGPVTGDCIRILNTAPAIAEAASLFDECDVVIVNQHELAFYLGLGEAPVSAEDALVARRLIRRAEQAVIVTLGAAGAIAVWSDRYFHATALPVTPVDTIGAGDCFCGALAALLDAGESIEAALPVANAAAALCTLKAGAIPAMPNRAEVDTCMASSPQ